MTLAPAIPRGVALDLSFLPLHSEAAWCNDPLFGLWFLSPEMCIHDFQEQMIVLIFMFRSLSTIRLGVFKSPYGLSEW